MLRAAWRSHASGWLPTDESIWALSKLDKTGKGGHCRHSRIGRQPWGPTQPEACKAACSIKLQARGMQPREQLVINLPVVSLKSALCLGRSWRVKGSPACQTGLG